MVKKFVNREIGELRKLGEIRELRSLSLNPSSAERDFLVWWIGFGELENWKIEKIGKLSWLCLSSRGTRDCLRFYSLQRDASCRQHDKVVEILHFVQNDKLSLGFKIKKAVITTAFTLTNLMKI